MSWKRSKDGGLDFVIEPETPHENRARRLAEMDSGVNCTIGGNTSFRIENGLIKERYEEAKRKLFKY